MPRTPLTQNPFQIWTHRAGSPRMLIGHTGGATHGVRADLRSAPLRPRAIGPRRPRHRAPDTEPNTCPRRRRQRPQPNSRIALTGRSLGDQHRRTWLHTVGRVDVVMAGTWLYPRFRSPARPCGRGDEPCSA